MIKNVLLDLDDTIFDFHKAEKIALSKTLESLGVEPTDEVCARYSEINASLWRRLERGEMEREEVLVSRFGMLFEEIGADCEALEARRRYEKNLSVGHYFVEGAVSLLDSLFGKYKLYLASNGTAAVQIPRIDSSPIEKYFDGIFISEIVGFNKPDARFFKRIFENIGGFSREETIIVGDSLSSDILGGKNVGIKTCLFNPKAREISGEIQPDFEIRALSELPALLESL